MKAVDKVFQCNDMRKYIFDYVITKFIPSHHPDTLRCSKVMKYYKKQLEYRNLHSATVFNSNIDEYILQFIKFSDEFKIIEKNIKKKFPEVEILVNELSLSKYGYIKKLNLICYNIQIFLCVNCSSNSNMSAISKLLILEMCKINVPWISLISDKINFDYY